VDVNSGVESAPGVKDSAKLKAFADALRQVPAPAAN
jgi:phosphoribosylanthranilate isomerase